MDVGNEPGAFRRTIRLPQLDAVRRFVGGEEEQVEVVGSREEELAGRRAQVRQRRFRLRTSDGSRLDVVQREGEPRWRVEDDLPTGPIREGGQ